MCIIIIIIIDTSREVRTFNYRLPPRPAAGTELMIAALMMEAKNTSETSVNFRVTIRHNIPEDSHLHAPHFFVNITLIHYCRSQIFEMRQSSERFIVYLGITSRDYFVYLFVGS
jgi:hypothetical protein